MSATYSCPTAEVALKQAQHAMSKGYRTLTITSPSGEEVEIVELEARCGASARDVPTWADA